MRAPRRSVFIVSLCVASLFASPARASWVTLDHTDGPVTLPNVPQVAVVGGEALSLRLNPRGDVVLRRGETEQVVAPSRTSGGRISLPVLYVDGAGVHAFWRVKLGARIPEVGGPGDKLIYVRSSNDGGKTFGPASRLNQQGGAFQPRVAGNGQGAVYAVWVDERHGPYHIFLNRSPDGGKRWKEGDVQLDIRPPSEGRAIDPALAAEGEQVWVAWMEPIIKGEVRRGGNRPGAEQTETDGFGIFLRRSSDRGESWVDPVLVSKVALQPVTPTLLRVKGKLLLYWFNGKHVLGAISADDGRTWTPIDPLPGSQEASGLAAAADPASGRVVVAYTVGPEGKKHALFATSSSDGVQFEAPVHLPRKTPHLTTSILPEIVLDWSGTVMVLWQDLRYLRSTVCARVSKDGGRSWLPQDFCLEEQPGKFNAYFPKGAGDGNGRFYGVWVRNMDDRTQKTQVVLGRVDPERPPAGPPPGEASRTRLEQRVSEYWKSRIAAEWGKGYDFMDPVFQSRVRREAYIGTQGVVKYYDFNTTKMDLTERIAWVTVRYTMEIPELDVQGRLLKVPKGDEETVQEWVWMDGDWHLVFKDLMGQAFFRY